MSSKRYPEEFKIAAVKQVTDSGYLAPDLAKRLSKQAEILLRHAVIPTPRLGAFWTSPVLVLPANCRP